MKGELRYCIDYVRPNCPYIGNGVLNVRHFRTLSEEEANNVLTIILGCGCKLIDLYRGNVQDGKLEEWNPLPMIVNVKEDFYVDGEFDSYSYLKGHKQGYKDAIKDACELLARMIWEVTYEDIECNSTQHYDKIEFIEEFKKAMEEQQ